MTVANICDKSLDDKSRRIQHIETLMAFDLFCNYKFRWFRFYFYVNFWPQFLQWEHDCVPEARHWSFARDRPLWHTLASRFPGMFFTCIPHLKMLFQGKAELSWLASPTSRQGAGKWASLPHRVPDSGIWPTLLCLLYRFEIKGATQVEQWQNTCGSDPSTNCGRSGHNKKEKHPVAGHLYHQKKFCSKLCIFQVIDTTLLKCYLQTNDALVASLLRLKDNNCHLVEAERVLKKASKFTELVRTAKFAWYDFFSTGLPLFRTEMKNANKSNRDLLKWWIFCNNRSEWFIDNFSFWFWTGRDN